MFDTIYEDDDNGILEEMEQYRKKKTMGSVMNKKKLNKFEMDDFFMGG